MVKKREFTQVELEEFIGEAVSDYIIHKFKEACNDHSFKTEYVTGPYGDTEVEVAQFIDEDDEVKFREDLEKEWDVDSIIQELAEDEHFKESINDMIQHVIWNKELEV